VLLAVCNQGRAGERRKVFIKSTVDGTPQPSYVILPKGFDPEGKSVPLIVALHSWSGDLEQRRQDREQLAERRGWIYLAPNFRGRNDNPAACGSQLAQQDILDAVEWAQEKYPIDKRRVYLTGASGGGHMTMLMAGRHPDVWAAASAWVGISDLAAWHKKHADTRYGEMMRRSCGGAPGDSAEVDKQYRARSPLTHLHRAVNVPLDIAAGVHDGYTGSVPIRHSLDAFNMIAKAAKSTTISEDEIKQISRKNGRLDKPLASDQVKDASFGREIYLRRTANKARVTIFEGGHEGIATAAIEWLAKHKKAE
jgi:dipeptidyl aminopeptidase/acylaminoacyl peptidase